MEEFLRHHPARQTFLLQEDKAPRQSLHAATVRWLPGRRLRLHRHVIGKLIERLVEAGVYQHPPLAEVLHLPHHRHGDQIHRGGRFSTEGDIPRYRGGRRTLQAVIVAKECHGWHHTQEGLTEEGENGKDGERVWLKVEKVDVVVGEDGQEEVGESATSPDTIERRKTGCTEPSFRPQRPNPNRSWFPRTYGMVWRPAGGPCQYPPC